MRRSNIGGLLCAVSATAQYTPPAIYTSVPEAYNPVVPVSSCQSLTCTQPNGSVCSTVDNPGPPKGVGIAANAIDLNTTSISYSLINGMAANGFTGIGSSQYEYSDQQLFVGLDPNLDEDSYPTGCVLMMQYLAQTFPLEPYIDTTEPEKNTTSCNGVLNVFCQSDLSGMIRSFNTSQSSNSSNVADGLDKCALLTRYVNAQLQQNDGTCSGEGKWIANFMNATGGSLPTPQSSPSAETRLGSDECKPIEPASYQMYKVASMRQLYFADPPDSDTDYYGSVFGGQAGWTPVITVVYGEDGEEIGEQGIQFSCLQTFQPDGEEREDIYESVAARGPGMSNVSLLMLFGLAGVVLVV